MFSLVGIWVLAMGMFLLPPWLGATYGSDALSDWVGVYFAGGFGGFVLELTASRGQIELPSTRGPQRDPGDEEATQLGNPLGRQVDLGFFSRMMLGALAAFTVLLLAKFLSVGAKSQDFATSATAVSTLAWAVAIGFTSPAAWAAVKKLTEARYKAALAVKEQRNKDKNKLARGARAKLDDAEKMLEKSRRNPSVRGVVRNELTARFSQENIGATGLTQEDVDQIIQLVGPPDEHAEEAAHAIDECRGVLDSLYSLGE